MASLLLVTPVCLIILNVSVLGLTNGRADLLVDILRKQTDFKHS